MRGASWLVLAVLVGCESAGSSARTTDGAVEVDSGMAAATTPDAGAARDAEFPETPQVNRDAGFEAAVAPDLRPADALEVDMRPGDSGAPDKGPVGSAILQFRPSTYEVATSIGNSIVAVAYVTNVGAAPAVGWNYNARLEYADARELEITLNACLSLTGPLEPGATCEIRVTFRALQKGAVRKVRLIAPFGEAYITATAL